VLVLETLAPNRCIISGLWCRAMEEQELLERLRA
jgi:hypothetical protein